MDRRTFIGTVAAAVLARPAIGNAQSGKLVIGARDDLMQKMLSGTLDRYKQAHPDQQIEVLNLTYTGLYDKLVVNLGQHTGAIDVFINDDIWLPQFAKSGWLRSLDEFGPLDPDFVPSAVNVGELNGALYGVPWIGNVQMFAYRKDLLESAGLKPPKTMSEVVDDASKLGTGTLKGIVFRGVKSNPIVTGYIPILRAYGGEIVDDAGKIAIGSDAAVRALDAYLRMKALSVQDVMSYNSGEVRAALQQGTSAMALEVWPSWVPDLDNPAVSKVVGKVDLESMPGEVRPGQPLIGIWSWAIAANSKKAKEAWEFIQFVTTSQEDMRNVLDYNNPPVRQSSYANPQALARNRFLTIQLEALKAGAARPRLANYPKLESIMGDYLSLAMAGQMPSQAAVSQMARALTRAMASSD